MRREIERFISICQERMKAKNWGVAELVKEMGDGNRVHRATVYQLLKKEHNPSLKTVAVVGDALGLDASEIEKVAVILRVKSVKKEQVPKPPDTFDSIERKLRHVQNICSTAKAELGRVDLDLAGILDQISQRLRLNASFRNHTKGLGG